MKILTRTDREGVVIELNQSEFLEFRNLIEAVEGKILNETYQIDYHSDRYAFGAVDLSSAFGAIRTFYLQKFRVNEIEKGLNILKDSIK